MSCLGMEILPEKEVFPRLLQEYFSRVKKPAALMLFSYKGAPGRATITHIYLPRRKRNVKSYHRGRRHE